MIKAIIFDLDGVLADTERTRFNLLKSLVAKRGLVLLDEQFKKIIGRRTEAFLKEVFGDRLSEEEVGKIFKERKEEYHKNPKKYIISEPHAYECTKGLFEAGFILAIASGSSDKDIKLVLSELKILPFFKVFVGANLVNNMKPHPETYLRCVEKLSLKKEECLAIEDAPVGVQAAKSAGLVCVAVTHTHVAEELWKADKIIDSLEEFTTDFINKTLSFPRSKTIN